MGHTSPKGSYDAAHRVRVLDNFSTGARANVQAVQDQLAAESLACPLEVVEGSILDQQTLATAMQGIEYVFHQAALPRSNFPCGSRCRAIG